MTKIIIASGPVIVEDNKVLLNKHGIDNFWKFCGGRIEETEANVKDTAKREAKEEMGLDIKILNKEPFFFYTKKENVSVVLIHFLAKRLNKIIPGKDIREWAWIEMSNLEKEELAPNILPALKHFGYIK